MDVAPSTSDEESHSPKRCKHLLVTLTEFEKYAVFSSKACMLMRIDMRYYGRDTRPHQDDMIARLLQRDEVATYVKEANEYLANLKAEIRESRKNTIASPEFMRTRARSRVGRKRLMREHRAQMHAQTQISARTLARGLYKTTSHMAIICSIVCIDSFYVKLQVSALIFQVS
jgi:hypothetical protein